MTSNIALLSTLAITTPIRRSQSTVLRCCQKMCLQNIGLDFVNSCRREVKYKSMEEKKMWLLNIIMHTFRKKRAWKFVVKEKILCRRAFCKCYDISKHLFYICNLHCRDETIPVHGNLGRLNTRAITEKMITWITNHVQDIGDASVIEPNKYYLPFYCTKDVLRKDALEDLRAKNKISPSDTYSLQAFCKVTLVSQLLEIVTLDVEKKLCKCFYS